MKSRFDTLTEGQLAMLILYLEGMVQEENMPFFEEKIKPLLPIEQEELEKYFKRRMDMETRIEVNYVGAGGGDYYRSHIFTTETNVVDTIANMNNKGFYIGRGDFTEYVPPHCIRSIIIYRSVDDLVDADRLTGLDAGEAQS